MKVLSSVDHEVKCVLTKDEILMLKNCLGEVCFGINVAEFQTRIGFSRHIVEEYAKEFKKITGNLGLEE